MYRSADSSINQSIKICAGNSGDPGGVLRCDFSCFILAGSGDVWFPHYRGEINASQAFAHESVSHLNAANERFFLLDDDESKSLEERLRC